MTDYVVDARILCEYRLPISLHNDVLMQGPFPLTVTEWVQFMTVLEAMHPGLVAPVNPAPSEDSEPPW